MEIRCKLTLCSIPDKLQTMKKFVDAITELASICNGIINIDIRYYILNVNFKLLTPTELYIKS